MVIRVLIIDDHPVTCAGIEHVFSTAGDISVVGVAGTVADGLELMRTLNPDLISMDLNMPDLGGLEAINKILHENPKQKVLVLTVYTADIFPISLLRAGACGYLTKDRPPAEIIQAVRTIYQGQHYLTPDVAQRLALGRISTSSDSPFDVLSTRELQVTQRIAAGQNPNQIAKELFLSNKTVNTYRYRIFSKLRKYQITNDIRLALLALEYGIVSNLSSAILMKDETGEQKDQSK